MTLNPALRALVSGAASKYKNTGDMAKVKEGRSTWRILAPVAGAADWVPASGQFWVDLGVHWIKADENGKPIVVLGDSEVCYGTPSVVVTAISMAIENAPDEASKKLYESWRSRKTIVVNAVDRSTDQVVQLELTANTWGKYIDQLEIYLASDDDITSMTTGKDIIIQRDGKGLQTEYTIMVKPGNSAAVSKDQIEKIVDLPAFIKSKFFRGEEQKALNAIQQIAGIAVPALGGGSRTPTAALTSSAARVADAAPAATPAVDPAIAAAAAAKAARAEKLRLMQIEMAALNEDDGLPVESTPPVKPAVAAVAAAPASANGLSQSEEEAILAELDNLTA